MSDDGNQNLNAEPQPTHRSEAHYENSKELHTIYIKNLSDATRAKDLGVLFEKFGKLIRCDVPEPRPEQSPYAFVEYELSSDANKAFNEMQGVEVQDHKLELAWARRRSGRPAFRGRYPPRGSYRGRFDRGGFRGPSGFRGRYSSPYSRGGPPCNLIN